MTEQEWKVQAARLRVSLKIARQGVYFGQPEAGREESYKRLRDAEDALRRHQDDKAILLASAGDGAAPAGDQTG